MRLLLAVVAIAICAPCLAQGGHATPTEFVTQVLEPTGGKIPRPKDWYYTESHRGASYSWILSREDASKGRYETGMRVQTIVGVQQRTGKPAKQFVLDFVAQKKAQVPNVVSTCGEQNQGLFTRVCLEADEGPYRIQYSLFWGTEPKLDVVVVSIAGAPRDLWSIYAPAFQRMSAFELIDMSRFQK
jgi:hypothetical protein